MAKKTPAPQSEKLKFAGKSVVRHDDVILIPGEEYERKNLTGPYLEGLIAQNFFEAVAEEDQKNDNPKPVE